MGKDFQHGFVRVINHPFLGVTTIFFGAQVMSKIVGLIPFLLLKGLNAINDLELKVN